TVVLFDAFLRLTRRNINYKMPWCGKHLNGGSMSSSYVLNLTMGNPAILSSTDAQAGRFDSTKVDPTSKVWYQLNGPWPATLVGQQVKMSTDPNININLNQPFPDGQSFNCNLGDSIYIRVAADSSWDTTPVPTGITLSVNFGRTDTAQHDGDTI